MNTEISITTAEKIDLYAEMKKRLDELKKAFEAQNANLIDALKDLEAEIKEDVLECGETVRGESMMACWVSGKTTWDGKTLKVLEKQFPEIGTPRFLGVTIDKVFDSQMDALAEGYTEPTHYHKDGWGIYGKHIAFKDGFVKFSWGAYKEGK